MAMASRSTLFLLGIAMLLSNVFALEAGKYNYENPAIWGSLSPNYAACSSGQKQSPIDIVEVESVADNTLGPLKRKYRLNNATLTSTGVDIMVRPQGESFFIIDGKRYSLLNIHWHTPSEHRLNGLQYPAELHQVHRAADGSIAVVSTLCSYGNPDPTVAQLQPTLNALPKKTCADNEVADQILLGKFGNKLLRPMSGKYYRYHGSLTTPPCSETTTWTVMAKVKTMSMEQVAALKAPLCPLNKNNSRPVQPLNGRKVQRFDGKAKI